MKLRIFPLLLVVGLCANVPPCEAEELVAVSYAARAEGTPPTEELQPTWNSMLDAKSLTLSVPAPRGQIVDRHGRPLAQNRIASYAAVQLPSGDGVPDEEVLAAARPPLEEAARILGRKSLLDDETILTHYRNRRWLPLVFPRALNDAQERALARKADSDASLVLVPTYCRYYPENKLAAHIVGYVGKVRARPTTDAQSGETMWPETEGRDGLEQSFDGQLRGRPGVLHRIYDGSGRKVVEELQRRPAPGNNIVTTLDLDYQKWAEEALDLYCRRGAFVVIDVENGDILAMASRPSFDLNSFVPELSTKTFAALRENPDLPLFARTFRGVYPPASTFKIATALAALDSGTVTPSTTFNAPGALRIGRRYFKNWHTGSEGRINVSRALTRSCNTWFYQVGMKTGGDVLAEMAMRLGFGERSGIPLHGEAPGLMPTDAFMRERFHQPFVEGHVANASIGQGNVLASPLQVAQMMAAVGNGQFLPKLRLVRQVQDLDGNVIESFSPASRHELSLDAAALRAVREGLIGVVHGGDGTGHGADNGYHTVAGKTGTGQWNLAQKSYVAWFAGFTPADAPKYAFAALYEGSPGQYLSGGKNAAPMVAHFFRRLFSGEQQSQPNR